MPTPYTLHLGDCLEIMGTLPAASVDAIVTDPPYGQSNESYESEIAFRRELWAAAARVAKPDAALISFAGAPTYHRIASAIEAGGWRVRQMWAWVYRDGMIASAYPREGFDRLAPAMDPICFATRGKVLLNVRREGDGAWAKGESSRKGRAFSERSDQSKAARRAIGHYPKAIASDGSPPFEYFSLPRARRDARKTGHPNQKPLALMSWLVGKLPPGSVVLDPFSGSASTGEAALMLDMPFVGIERDAAYHAMAANRLAVAARDAANRLAFTA